MGTPAISTGKRTRRPRVGPLAASVVTVAAVAGGLAAVAVSTEPYGRIEGENTPPLAVTIRPAQRLDGYQVTREFVGVVEARRESRIGFELGGELVEVLVDEGDLVEAGAVVARLDTSILEAERAARVASRDEARAALELAELTRSRMRTLRERGAASPHEWDEVDKTYDERSAGLARAEAAVAAIDTRMARSALVAPYPALVARRHADEGQVVAPGAGILDLLERVEPEVRIGVAGNSVEAISVGAAHELRVGDRLVPATVRRVLPVRGSSTRSVEVILTLHAEFDGIRRGDLAILSLVRDQRNPGFWLPLSALTESSRGLWACYVAQELRETERVGLATHRLRRRELEVLHQEVDRVFVRGTLSDGEAVVLEGLHRLVPDQFVRLAGEDAFTTIEG